MASRRSRRKIPAKTRFGWIFLLSLLRLCLLALLARRDKVISNQDFLAGLEPAGEPADRERVKAEV